MADLFDLSRERVRQLTPTINGNGRTPLLGGNRRPSDQETVKHELENVFRQAAHDPEAWNCHGQVSKAWVVDRLGYEPNLSWLDFRRPANSKAEFILRYGLGLGTRAQMRAWFEEMHFDRHMVYGEIAAWLSDRFVPVATMTIHGFVTDVLDIEGYGRGTGNDR
jgi:hypothetical protein